eukprot:gene20666-24820_t
MKLEEYIQFSDQVFGGTVNDDEVSVTVKVPANTDLDAFLTYLVTAFNIVATDSKIENDIVSFNTDGASYALLVDHPARFRGTKIEFVRKSKHKSVLIEGLKPDTPVDILVTYMSSALDVVVSPNDIGILSPTSVRLELDPKAASLLLRIPSHRIAGVIATASMICDVSLLVVLPELIANPEVAIGNTIANYGLEVGPSAIQMNADGLLARVSLPLSSNQLLSDIRDDGYHTRIAGKWVSLVPDHGHVIKFLSSDPLTPAQIRDIIVSHKIDPAQILDIVVKKSTCEGFVNLESDAAKRVLSTLRITLPLDNTPQQQLPTTTTTTTTANTIITTNIPRLATVDKIVDAHATANPVSIVVQRPPLKVDYMTSNDANGTSKYAAVSTIIFPVSKDTTDVDIHDSFKPHPIYFTTIRDGLAYIESDTNTCKALLKFDENVVPKGIVPHWKIYWSPIPMVPMSLVRKTFKDIGIVVGNVSKEANNLVIPVATKKMLKALIQRAMVTIPDKQKDNRYQKGSNKKNIKMPTWYWLSEQPFSNDKHIVRDIGVSNITKAYFVLKRKDLVPTIRKTFGVHYTHHEYIDAEKKKTTHVLRLTGPQERQSAIDEAAEFINAQINALDPKTKLTDLQNDNQIALFYTLINKMVEPNSVKVVHMSTKKDKFTMITSFIGLKRDQDLVMARVANIKGVSIKVTPIELSNANLVPSYIEKEFNTLISIEDDYIHCLGDAQDTDSLVAFIESKIRREIIETIFIDSGPMYFFKKHLERSIIASGVKVSCTNTTVYLTGDQETVTKAKTLLESLRSQLVCTNITKVISTCGVPALGVFLNDYFKNDDQVFAYFKTDKNTISQTEDTDDDDEDDQPFMEKLVTVNIYVWTHKDTSNQVLPKIQTLAFMKPGRAINIPVSYEVLNSVKKEMSTDDSSVKNVLFLSAQKKIVVQGLWAQDVLQLESIVNAKKEDL